MSSLQPISSAAMSALIWELESNATAIFGSSPIGDIGSVPTTPNLGAGGKLSRVLSMLRRRVLPRVVQSLNTSKVKVVWRTRVKDPDDPLAAQYNPTDAEIYVTVSGPTVKTLERGLLAASDYEVLIPAASLTTPLGEEDAIELDGVLHDIVGVQAHPMTPPAVAYRYLAKRAA